MSLDCSDGFDGVDGFASSEDLSLGDLTCFEAFCDLLCLLAISVWPQVRSLTSKGTGARLSRGNVSNNL